MDRKTFKDISIVREEGKAKPEVQNRETIWEETKYENIY